MSPLEMRWTSMSSLELQLPIFCSLFTNVNEMDFYERIAFDGQDLFWAFLSGIHTDTRMGEVIQGGYSSQLRRS